MIWIAAAIILLALSFALGMGVFVYAAYALLAIFFVTRWFAGQWIASVTAKRTCLMQEGSIGDLLAVEVEVKNTGRLPISWMLIEDLVPEDNRSQRARLEIKNSRVQVVKLKAGQTYKFRYQILCKYRGYYQIGPLVAETGDLFGLHRKYRVLGDPIYVQINPETEFIDGYNIQSRRPIGEIIMTHRLFEDPTRISGIREYQAGDPLNRVHWRATARTGKLQCKQYDPSSLAGASLLIDFHRDSFDTAHEPVRSELSVTAAASLANTVFEMGEQIGIVSNGVDAADRIRFEGWRGDARTREEARKSATARKASDRLRPVTVPTRKSPDQIVPIMDALARLELSRALPFPAFVLEVASDLPRDATVIAILSNVNMEAAVALGNLRRQGYAVTAILNCYDREHYARCSAPLMGEGIETRHLRDQLSIASICEKQAALAYGS